MINAKTIKAEIALLFLNNELNDLKSMLKKRKYLNMANLTLIYAHHIFQATGILITSLATNYDFKTLVLILLLQ